MLSGYYSPIHSKHVIGTNVAFKLGTWISVLYFCDKTFFLTNKNELQNFHNLKVTDTQNLAPKDYQLHRNIKKLKRDHTHGLTLKKDSVRWNLNSGAAAINFAVQAGAKRVLLLGFDMNWDEGGKSHWHSVYARPTPPVVFTRFLQRFPRIAEDAKKLGVEILNVNPDSAINCFPKVELKEVL